MKRLFVISALALPLLAACGKKEEAAAPAATSNAASAALLSYVPADTPYVFTNLQPAPAAVTEKFKPLNKRVFTEIGNLFESLADAEVAEETSAEQKAAFAKGVAAARTRFGDGDLSEFGVDSATAVVAFYGNGLLPVMRMSLAEPAKFMPELDAMLAEMEATTETMTLDGADLRLAALEDAGQLIIGRQGDAMVVTFGPEDFDPADLEQLLAPASKSMASSSVLADLAADYDYLPYGLGFLDLRKVFATMTGDASGLDAKLLAMGNEEGIELDETCAAEIGGIVANFPRMVLGTTQMDTNGIATLPVLEMNPAIAKSLMNVAGSVPGLTSDSSAGFKFGFAFNMAGLREFVDEQIAPIADDPYQCEELAEINETAVSMVDAMNQPLPPLVDNFQGFFMEMNSLDGIDFTSAQVPENLDMNIVLAMDNVNGLLEFGKMMTPMLQGLDLQPDGKAVEVPADLTAGMVQNVFAAMTNNLLAFSVGDGADTRAADLAAATDASENMLLAVSVNYSEYAKLMRGMQEQMAAKVNPDDEEAQATIDGSMMAVGLTEAYAEVVERESGGLKVTPKGLAAPSYVTLKK